MPAKEYFPVRGIIEGFYGPPWSHGERLEAIVLGASLGLSHYMYAPKDDIYHRQRWRDRYPRKEGERIRELASASRKRGGTFIFAISPGLSIDYTSAADFRKLVAKCRRMADLGVNGFALLLDDIPNKLPAPAAKRYRSFGEAHADLGSRFFEALAKDGSQTPVFVCPTEYCTAFAKNDVTTSRYLGDFGARLHPEVDVFWTGREVIPETMTVKDLEPVVEVLRRKPVIWENFHANDYCLMRRVFLGPLEGRDPRLDTVTRGLMTNPNDQFEANRIAFMTTADYLKNPRTYNAQKSWERALRSITGNRRAFDALKTVAGFYYTAFRDGPQAQKLIFRIEKVLMGKASARTVSSLKRSLEALVNAHEVLEVHLADKKLFYQLFQYLLELRYTADHFQQLLSLKGPLPVSLRRQVLRRVQYFWNKKTPLVSRLRAKAHYRIVKGE